MYVIYDLIGNVKIPQYFKCRHATCKHGSDCLCTRQLASVSAQWLSTADLRSRAEPMPEKVSPTDVQNIVSASTLIQLAMYTCMYTNAYMCLHSCISSGDTLPPQKALVPRLISLRKPPANMANRPAGRACRPNSFAMTNSRSWTSN